MSCFFNMWVLVCQSLPERNRPSSLWDANCQTDIHNEPLYCRISTQKAIYKIPYQDILFIESEQKKSVIHLLKKTICVSVPLYRILEVLPKETFVQTHRSFIVSLKNTSSIDKSQNPWTISFFGSEQLAFVGRSFKDNIMQIIRPTLDLDTSK